MKTINSVYLASWVMSVILATGCSSQNRGQHQPTAPNLKDAQAAASGGGSGTPTYTKDVQPILQKRCAACHNSSSNVPNWLNYSVAYRYRTTIFQRVVVAKSMPMAPYNTAMTDDERNLIGAWVQAGAPEKSGGGVNGNSGPSTGSGGDSADHGGTPGTSSGGSGVGAPPATLPATLPATEPPVFASFADMIQPIFKNRCFRCHKADNPDLPSDYHYPNDFSARSYRKDWGVYKNALLYKDIILSYVKNLTMPPDNVTQMTNRERSLVVQWVENGANFDKPFSANADWANQSTYSTNGCVDNAHLEKGSTLPVTYTKCVKPIFAARCIPCHTHGEYQGVDALSYDSVYRVRGAIYSWVYAYSLMPLDNVTNMTAAERMIVAKWVVQGGKDDPTPPPVQPTRPVHTGLRYAKDILPIIKNRCGQCHNPDIATPPNWQNYGTAYQYRDKIQARAYTLKTMPPENSTKMTDEERQIVSDWVQSGAVE